MRKQELVQLHTLCDALREYLVERRDAPPGAFHAYDEQGILPAAIHRNKQVHEEALHLLLDGLTAAVDAEPASVPREASPEGNE